MFFSIANNSISNQFLKIEINAKFNISRKQITCLQRSLFAEIGRFRKKSIIKSWWSRKKCGFKRTSSKKKYATYVSFGIKTKAKNRVKIKLIDFEKKSFFSNWSSGGYSLKNTADFSWCGSVTVVSRSRYSKRSLACPCCCSLLTPICANYSVTTFFNSKSHQKIANFAYLPPFILVAGNFQ